ncbi:RES family NAD+ phosphorylase [Sabulicella glaciei]|uniref:RES domain-containing protein n=1 Tax=Sabulicella glaciei TaxID=2984948 RepID=A0ABT3NSB2_9PROT|nr:RES domain-containing protein [Roseococcus sp. MDT2-1-1]
MTRTAWRIATDAPGYGADDLSGAGAKRTGGRWNEKELPVLYASENRALACLETMAHLNAGGLPLNRYLVEIVIPDAVWDAREEHRADALPVGWDARPPSRTSIGFGTAWLLSRRTALLVLPSVIVPEERNVLINPQHPAAAAIAARKLRLWTYDPRLSGRL